MNELKTREQRVRRKLARQGYTLHKSRTGGTVRLNGQTERLVDDCGGYMIVETSSNTIVAGERYDLSLPEVERWAAE